jgi:hypothetical protein
MMVFGHHFPLCVGDDYSPVFQNLFGDHLLHHWWFLPFERIVKCQPFFRMKGEYCIFWKAVGEINYGEQSPFMSYLKLSEMVAENHPASCEQL